MGVVSSPWWQYLDPTYAGLTECLEHEIRFGLHTLSQPAEHQYEILDRLVRQCCPPLLSKHQMRQYLWKIGVYPSSRVHTVCRFNAKMHSSCPQGSSQRKTLCFGFPLICHVCTFVFPGNLEALCFYLYNTRLFIYNHVKLNCCQEQLLWVIVVKSIQFCIRILNTKCVFFLSIFKPGDRVWHSSFAESCSVIFVVFM